MHYSFRNCRFKDQPHRKQSTKKFYFLSYGGRNINERQKKLIEDKACFNPFLFYQKYILDKFLPR